MKRQRVQLGGKTWTVQESKRKLKDCYGYCEPASKLIVLSKGLTPEQRREYFFHEALHGQFWFLAEDIVETAAIELHEAADSLDFDD